MFSTEDTFLRVARPLLCAKGYVNKNEIRLTKTIEQLSVTILSTSIRVRIARALIGDALVLVHYHVQCDYDHIGL